MATQIGTPLRDAAEDPEGGDFLEPFNAGDDDPHSPAVVSPGIHGNEGVHPITPGAVSGTPATQEAAEKAHAKLFLDWSLTVNPDEVELEPEDTQAVTLTVTWIDSTTQTVTAGAVWESSDEEVATVAAGTITAVADGECTVTGTYNGKTATVAVTVATVGGGEGEGEGEGEGDGESEG